MNDKLKQIKKDLLAYLNRSECSRGYINQYADAVSEFIYGREQERLKTIKKVVGEQ